MYLKLLCIFFITIPLLGLSQAEIEDKLLGCWTYDSEDNVFNKVEEISKMKFRVKFKSNNILEIGPHYGSKTQCGNQLPKLIIGSWVLKDSILTIKYMFENDSVLSKTYIKEITHKRFKVIYLD